jgi:hypothetical protein
MKKSILYLAAFFTLSIAIQAQTVVPYLQKNGKYIFVDSANMKPIANAKEFDKANELEGGFWEIGILKPDNSKGFKEYSNALYNKNGKALTDFTFEGFSYSGGKLVETQLNSKWGLIDTTGKVVVLPKFQSIFQRAASNGLICVELNDMKGFIDTNGKQVLPFIYKTLFGFNDDGWALVSIKESYELLFIDKTGKIVLKPKQKNIESIDEFSEGLAPIQIGINGKYGYINKSGNMVIQPQFFSVSSFYNGVAEFGESDDAFGLIDKTGKKIVPAKYNSILQLDDGNFVVEKENKYGVIDKKGVSILPIKFDKIYRFQQNLFVIENGESKIINTKGKVIHTFKGNYSIDAGYFQYEKGLLLVSKNEKFGLIDSFEKNIIPIEYSSERFEINKFIQAINKNGKTTFFDKTGRAYAEK